MTSMMKRVTAAVVSKWIRMPSIALQSSIPQWPDRVSHERSKLVVEEVNFPNVSAVTVMKQVSFESNRPGVSLKGGEVDRTEFLKKEQIPIDEAPHNQSSG
jgi:hypothetical protein